LSVAAKIPVEVTVTESENAVRELAASEAGLAILLGDLSQGDRSFLGSFNKVPPREIPLGWEVPRFIARTGSGRGPIRWESFRQVLRGATAEAGVFDKGWTSARALEFLRPRFLVLGRDQVKGTSAIGFERTALEAMVLKKVLEEEAAIGLVFSLDLAHQGVETLPIEVAGEAILPDRESVEKGRYPLARKVQMIETRRMRPGDESLRFAEFVLSASGQATIERSGFLPVGESSLTFGLSSGVAPIDR